MCAPGIFQNNASTCAPCAQTFLSFSDFETGNGNDKLRDEINVGQKKVYSKKFESEIMRNC